MNQYLPFLYLNKLIYCITSPAELKQREIKLPKNAIDLLQSSTKFSTNVNTIN